MAGYHFTLPLAAGELAGACVLAALLRAALTLHQLRALPEARREARTDPLTDLANRRHLHERCAHLLARPEAAPVTVLMIDLNGFKKVNDRHGHRVGDALLVQVATRLAAVLRRDDLLGRLGGDEFAALLPTTTTHQAHRIARRMHAVLAEPITVDAHTYSIGASIGISSINRPGSPPAALFHNADIAMYHAKTSRTGTAIAYRMDHAAHVDHVGHVGHVAHVAHSPTSPTLPPATPRRPGPPPARQLDHQKLGRGRSRAGEAVCRQLDAKLVQPIQRNETLRTGADNGRSESQVLPPRQPGTTARVFPTGCPFLRRSAADQQAYVATAAPTSPVRPLTPVGARFPEGRVTARCDRAAAA